MRIGKIHTEICQIDHQLSAAVKFSQLLNPLFQVYKGYSGAVKFRQFDGIELPWGTVNGKFTVSENIADNGGMAVTLDIMSHSEGVSFEEYFTNWARVWCQKAKPEYQALLLQVDVHGPAYLRCNMPPRNFPEWYETFQVKKSDEMYIAPSKRVVVW